MTASSTRHMLIERALREGTPLLDGDSATFVWAGERPPRLLGDFWPALWMDCEPKLAPVAPGVWACTVPLAPDAYVEYVYLLDGGQVADPFNSRTVTNGLG
ncbi:MAG: alpha/beta hydrolase-fold protein, partial [Ktedonobacterales bacterium]